MNKILNKLLLGFKNIILPIIMLIVIYIVIYMFRRLDKEIFGKNFLEFLKVILPFIILIFLNIINIILGHDEVRDNTFYNITSFLAFFTMAIFCYRALFDSNMYFWHKYDYHINFNYFADQIAPVKVMLYGLILADILLIICHYMKEEKVKKVIVDDSIDNKLNDYNPNKEEIDKEIINNHKDENNYHKKNNYFKHNYYNNKNNYKKKYK